MKSKTSVLAWILAGGALIGSIGARPLAAQPPGGQPARFPTDIRSQDGSGNNLAHPEWGQAGEAFRRRTAVAYEDGTNSPAGADRPSAREISNALATAAGSRPNARGASDFVWQWGQFLDHDLDLTLTADPAEPFDVEVPAGDPHFDPAGTGSRTIALDRSIYTMVRGVRQQTNAITAYIDASHIYGSDAERTRALRSLDGSGRMKTSPGDLLPFNEDGLPNAPSDSAAFFVTGDLRANEQVGLLALHTLFLREHNWWADRIRRDNAGLNDDQIFERARAIVGAEIQSITYNEFLPVLLGRGALRPYRGYRPQVSVAIENAFATAAYRLGHSMLSSTLPRLAANGRPIAAGNITLMNAFFNPAEITGPGIEPYLRGMAAQRAQELDNQLVDDVRNFLFGPPGAGGFDLASLNIQRGRDHGLPGYNQVRADFGLPRVTSFAQISSDPAVRAKLASVYDSPDQVDLWVGGLAEDHVRGALVGETFFMILRDQFERSRDGDRFWYESYLPRDLVQTVREQTLARIIRRNTTIGAEVQPNVFLVRGAR